MTPLTHYTSTGRLWLGWELKNMRPPTGSFFDLSTGVFLAVAVLYSKYVLPPVGEFTYLSKLNFHCRYTTSTQLVPAQPGITLAKRKVFFIILSRGLKTWNNAHRLYPVAHVWNGVLGYWKGYSFSLTAAKGRGAVGRDFRQRLGWIG